MVVRLPRLLASSLLLVLALAAPVRAATAPFPIPDLGLEATGAGPGNGARLAISAFEYRGPTKAPGFLPLELWTIAAGHKHPTHHRFTRAKINDGPITFVPGGSLLAHSEPVTTHGKKGYRVFMADLSLSGRVRSDTPISDPAQRGASAKIAPLVGADGTIGELYGAAAGDTLVPEWLVLRPSGQGAWTAPSPLPTGEYRNDLRLGPDGSGVVVSTPLDAHDNALLLSRFGRDGQLVSPVRIDLAGVRPPGDSDPLDLAVTITDSGTIVVALSVPAPAGTTAASHLLLITLPAGATTANVQDVGAATSTSGTVGTLDAQSTGGDNATVLAGGLSGGLRVFDAPTAATPTWAASAVGGAVGFEGNLLRLHGGGLAAILSTGGKHGTILGMHRAAGAPAFSAPTPLSINKYAHGEIQVDSATLLADDEVLVTYEYYGRAGDGTFALIGRP